MAMGRLTDTRHPPTDDELVQIATAEGKKLYEGVPRAETLDYPSTARAFGAWSFSFHWWISFCNVGRQSLQLSTTECAAGLLGAGLALPLVS